MFKFVVLCAIFAAAAAEPGALIAPVTQYTTYLAPGATSISSQSSSVIHPSPLGYYPATPYVYSHYIKKRSPQWPLTYAAPASYIAAEPFVAAAPASVALLPNTHVLPAVAPASPGLHLIKKRSAPLLPTTYYAPPAFPAAATPILTTSYAAASPLFPSASYFPQPLAYTQFIKK